jgi:hypothetical protein
MVSVPLFAPIFAGKLAVGSAHSSISFDPGRLFSAEMWRKFAVEGAEGAWLASQGRTMSRRLSGV